MMVIIYYIIQLIVCMKTFIMIITKIKLMNLPYYILALIIMKIQIVINVIHLIKVKMEGYAFLVNSDIIIIMKLKNAQNV